MILSLKIPPHLKCVAILPCEMSGVLKATTFILLNFIKIITRFSKFYLLILLLVPSDFLTDVIGIWSVFFESFVCL